MAIRRIETAEIGETVPLGVQHEAIPELTGARFILKNFASSPEVGRRYIESLGYETRPLNTHGFNFAVRKRGDSASPWRVLDPDTGIISGDFFNDVTDLISDAVSGVIVGGSAVAVSPLGGLAAGALTELGREAIGEALGIESNFDPLQIGLQGVVGAATPVAGRALGAVGRAVAPAARRVAGGLGALGELGAEAGARLAGVEAMGGLTPGQVLMQRAKVPLQSLPSPAAVGRRLQRLVRVVGNSKHVFPEKQVANKLLQRAEGQGITVDLAKQFDPLVNVQLVQSGERAVTRSVRSASTTRTTTRGTLESEATAGTQRGGIRTGETTNLRTGETREFGQAFERQAEQTTGRQVSGSATRTAETESERLRTVFEPELRARTRRAARQQAIETNLSDKSGAVINRIHKFVADATGVSQDNVDLRNIPIGVAAEIKQILQDIAASEGAFTGQPLDKELISIVRDISRAVRETVETGMQANGFKSYVPMMRIVENKTRALNTLRDALGQDDLKAERYIRSLYGNSAIRHEAIRDFERIFGLPARGIEESARRAVMGERFAGVGSRGVPGKFPRLGATGQFVGLSIFGVGGTFLGGPLGGAATIAGGLYGAAPRTILKATRAGMRLGQMRAPSLGVPAYMRDSARVSGVFALQQQARALGGKSVAREDQRKKKPTVLTGF